MAGLGPLISRAAAAGCSCLGGRQGARALAEGASRGGRSLLDAFCDVAVGGGASLVELYKYLNLWEVFFAMRFTARAPAAAAAAVCSARVNGKPFRVDLHQIELLRTFLQATMPLHQQVLGLPRGPEPAGGGAAALAAGAAATLVAAAAARAGCSRGARGIAPAAEVPFVGRLLRAMRPQRVAELTLPFGVPDGVLREWARAGLLRNVEELQLLGCGGPSDAGLTYIARSCPRLRRLSLLGSGASAAAVLLLKAQVAGALSTEWWRGFRCTRLCILPRLRRARQLNLAVQRLPGWFCGQWSPLVPTWGHEVQHYDAAGRVVCLRNNVVERVGVVRSMLPSPHGPWWELQLGFFSRRESTGHLLLILPIGTSGATELRSPALQGTWTGSAQEPQGTVRAAVAGPTESLRERPCCFPSSDQGHEWRRISHDSAIEQVFPWGDQEWAEAAVAASVDDTAAMFLDGPSDDESSEDEATLAQWLPGGAASSSPRAAMCHKCPSVEELLARLDLEEAEDWTSDPRPSARVAGGGDLPSIEELLNQLDAEEERDRKLYGSEVGHAASSTAGSSAGGIAAV